MFLVFWVFVVRVLAFWGFECVRVLVFACVFVFACVLSWCVCVCCGRVVLRLVKCVSLCLSVVGWKFVVRVFGCLVYLCVLCQVHGGVCFDRTAPPLLAVRDGRGGAENTKAAFVWQQDYNTHSKSC